MATAPKLPVDVDVSKDAEMIHYFDAKSEVLSGHLELPDGQKLHPHGRVKLNDDPEGGDFTKHLEPVNKGIVSFDSGSAEVTGVRRKDAWVTTAKAAIDGFKLADVIAVGHASATVQTEHPAVLCHHIPTVSFPDTRFDNFLVNGHPVQVEFDFGILGGPSNDDRLYTENLEFLEGVEARVASSAHSFGLSGEVKAHFDRELNQIRHLIEQVRQGHRASTANPRKVRFSLVKSIAPIPGVKIFGNVMEIPDFGIVSLGDIEVGEKALKVDNPYGQNCCPNQPPDRPCNYFELTMIEARLHSEKNHEKKPRAMTLDESASTTPGGVCVLKPLGNGQTIP